MATLKIRELCIFERIFESLIHPYLLHPVKSQIIPEQHGFFKGRSTFEWLFIHGGRFPTSEGLEQKTTEYKKKLEKKIGFTNTFEDMNINLLDTKLTTAICTAVKRVCGKPRRLKDTWLRQKTLKLMEWRERTPQRYPCL